jgi:monoamine oxidase
LALNLPVTHHAYSPRLRQLSIMTRRDFLEKTCLLPGGATLLAMTGLGFLSRASGFGAELRGLPKVAGKPGTKVTILGAGIAGMAAAYELGKLGFTCTILEAASRPGGRSLTIRRGDQLTDTLGHAQTCAFDEGHYFNAGPARFPQWQITMDYCRELGVAIEPFVNVNEASFYYNDGTGPLANQRVRQREVKADLRGHAAELLAKAVNADKLDRPFTKEDKETLLAFLLNEGDLDPDAFTYGGSTRRGFKNWPAVTTGGERDPAHELLALLHAGYTDHLHRANEFEYQPALFQPVGGMDMLAKALFAKVKDVVRFGCAAKEIRKNGTTGARVVYTEGTETKELLSDFCICALPPTILRTVPNDFAPLVKNTINVVPFQNSARIGLQFKRRFWEEDDRVFGGITWTNQPINEIYYPSHGFFQPKGVLIGYYMFGPACDEVTTMTPAARIEYALKQGEKIHPQYRAEFENAFSVNWNTVPHIKGCLSHFPEKLVKTLYPLVIKPDGPLYLAGDWVSHLGGWQAGAFESARHVTKQLHERVSA